MIYIILMKQNKTNINYKLLFKYFVVTLVFGKLNIRSLKLINTLNALI